MKLSCIWDMFEFDSTIHDIKHTFIHEKKDFCSGDGYFDQKKIGRKFGQKWPKIA